MRRLCIIAFVLSLAVHGFAAGAMGHNALGSIAIDRILNGTYAAPPELKEALKDPKVRQAFLGGSVGPDLFPTRTHRGNQSGFTQQMLNNAWQQYKAAGNDPAQKAKAAENLAFAYGWLAHVAADLNVHPKINGIVGDTYDENNAGEKGTHAALEAQLYAYLRRVAGIKDGFDARFPTDFIAEQLGVDPGEVKRAISRIRIIAAGEIGASNQVKLTDKQLKDAWSEAVREGMADTRRFLEKPTNFENWDLDCGKISTEDFEWLRKAVMELNGGKLPKDWGKDYMNLWNQIKDLPPGDRYNRLAAAMGKPKETTTNKNTGVPWMAKHLAERNMNVIVKVERDFVFPTRMHYPEAKLQWNGARFSMKVIFEDYPYQKDISIEGEVADSEVVSVKLEMTQTMKDNPGFLMKTTAEAKHVPLIQGGLWDEYVGDVTFAAFTETQAPGFSGSFKSASPNSVSVGYTYIWDKSTMKEASKNRTLYPIFTVRFREKKYGD